MPQAIAVCRDSKWAQLCTQCERGLSVADSTCPQHWPQVAFLPCRHRLDTGRSRGNSRMCRCARPANHLRIPGRRDSCNRRRTQLLWIHPHDAAVPWRKMCRRAKGCHNAEHARSDTKCGHPGRALPATGRHTHRTHGRLLLRQEHPPTLRQDPFSAP